jgi:hypothetical protein
MSAIEASDRLSKLYVIARWALVVLFAKVLVAIVWEYRWYFPANFDASAFLSGRRYTFVGLYRAAFYAHILCGPVAVVLGVFLMLSGGRARYRRIHRVVGRLQMLLVLAVLVPSGLAMAREAYSGPIAGLAFAALSVATGFSAAAAWRLVRARKFRSHRVWATRCFILLASPLLLRVIAGAVIVLDLESDLSYRLNAWLSWLLPLAVYEVWRWRGAGGNVIVASSSLPPMETLP